jgi:hypothetical protein
VRARARVRASGIPEAGEYAVSLAAPPSAEEASAVFERMAAETAGR